MHPHGVKFGFRQVEPVTSGCRVTVAYSILARPGDPSPPSSPGRCVSDQLTHAAWLPETAPLLAAVTFWG